MSRSAESTEPAGLADLEESERRHRPSIDQSERCLSAMIVRRSDRISNTYGRLSVDRLDLPTEVDVGELDTGWSRTCADRFEWWNGEFDQSFTKPPTANRGAEEHPWLLRTRWPSSSRRKLGVRAAVHDIFEVIIHRRMRLRRPPPIATTRPPLLELSRTH